MPVTRSVYTEGPRQADGSVTVIETHTVPDGPPVRVEYRIQPGADLQSIADARGARISDQLAKREALFAVTVDALPALVHQTKGEFVSRFWDMATRAGEADPDTWHRLMWWMEERLRAGDITERQATDGFAAASGVAVDAARWSRIRTDMLAAGHDRFSAWRAGTDP